MKYTGIRGGEQGLSTYLGKPPLTVSHHRRKVIYHLGSLRKKGKLKTTDSQPTHLR